MADGLNAQALRSSLQFCVGSLGQEYASTEDSLPLTGSAVSTLTEVLSQYADSFAADIRHFAKHAKRSVINTDDVKLVARKLPTLLQDLQTFEVEHLVKEKSGSGKKKRSKFPSSGSKRSRNDSSPGPVHQMANEDVN